MNLRTLGPLGEWLARRPYLAGAIIFIIAKLLLALLAIQELTLVWTVVELLVLLVGITVVKNRPALKEWIANNSTLFWSIVLFLYVVYHFSVGIPRYMEKGYTRRVERDQKEAVQAVRRLSKYFCRNEEHTEEALRMRLEGDLEEIHTLGHGGLLLVSSVYAYHYRPEGPAVSAYPRKYVSEEELMSDKSVEIGREHILNTTATHSFYIDCTFNVYFGDIGGVDPSSADGLRFYPE